MNKTIMTNDEWAVGFMEQLDTMLDGIENMNEKSRASFGNERFLTEQGGVGMAQGEPTYLAGLPATSEMVSYCQFQAARFSTRNRTLKSW